MNQLKNEILNWKLQSEDNFILQKDIDLSAVPLYLCQKTYIKTPCNLKFLVNIKNIKVVSYKEFLNNLTLISKLIKDPASDMVYPEYINMYIECHNALYKSYKKFELVQPFEIYKNKKNESLFFLLNFNGYIKEGYINKILFVTNLFKKFVKHNKGIIEYANRR